MKRQKNYHTPLRRPNVISSRQAINSNFYNNVNLYIMINNIQRTGLHFNNHGEYSPDDKGRHQVHLSATNVLCVSLWHHCNQCKSLRSNGNMPCAKSWTESLYCAFTIKTAATYTASGMPQIITAAVRSTQTFYHSWDNKFYSFYTLLHDCIAFVCRVLLYFILLLVVHFQWFLASGLRC